MKVRSVRHRGLRQLLSNDNSMYLPYDLTDRVRKILTALVLAKGMDDFVASAPRGWRVHRLSGDRRRHWSVSVSSN
ncbi:MAG: type II toxin-antitoxin system RelE/ParE family toxin [bacterium]|nr:type II toxin-antitoxin system RelE/ParE family toxin [bacterium]